MPKNFPDRLLILFPIPEINRPAAASLQMLEVTESGGQIEHGPNPVNPESIGDYFEKFSLSLIAECESLRSQSSQFQKDNEQFRSQVDSLTEALAKAQAEIERSNTAIADLNTRIEALLIAVPFNPRIVDAAAFLKRLSSEEAFALVGHPHETAQQIVEMLQQYKANDWPIMLDHEITRGAFSTLVQLGIVSEDRKKELLSDAKRDEAYVADETSLPQ